MSTHAHTPEPWRVEDGCIVAPWSEPRPVQRDDGTTRMHPSGLIALVYGPGDHEDDPSLEHYHGNRRRIVAAVNACAGIPVEALEGGVVREMLHALEYIVGWNPHEWSADRARDLARDAIAKATGMQPEEDR